MHKRKLLQGVQTVVNEQAARVCGILALVNHGVCAAFLKSHGSKLVAVERCALKREEQRAGRTVATVGSNDGMLGEDFV